MSSNKVKTDEIETFYVVSKKAYDSYVLKKRENVLCVNKFPKRVAKKVTNILKYLSLKNIKWDVLGCVKASEDLPKDVNVLEYAAFAITGRGTPPKHISTFIKVLVALEVPLKWLSLKVQVQYKKIQRNNKVKHGKKKEKDDSG